MPIVGEDVDLNLPTLWTIWDHEFFRWYQGWPTIDEAMVEHIGEREKYAPRVVKVYEIKRCCACGIYQPTGVVKEVNFAAWERDRAVRDRKES